MKLPTFAVIKEVGPRDGLQNEKKIVGTKDKVKWIQLLSEAGLSYIEVSSFVHPKWVPALADASDVFTELKRNSDITYAALVPNQNGLERALLQNVDEVNVFYQRVNHIIKAILISLLKKHYLSSKILQSKQSLQVKE